MGQYGDNEVFIAMERAEEERFKDVRDLTQEVIALTAALERVTRERNELESRLANILGARAWPGETTGAN